LAHNFDVSNFGEVIAAALWSDPTNGLSYTFDQGLNWVDCLYNDPTNNESHVVFDVYTTLEQETIYYHNIFAPYTTYSAAASFVWVATTTSTGDNWLFFVNISRTLPPCTSSDYETFTPAGPTSSCILGRQTTFTRKSRTAQCIPDPAILSKIVEQPCPCDRNDYYCIFCFVEALNRTCVLDSTNPQCLVDPATPPGCYVGTIVNVSTQYRKIDGTSCYGDVPALVADRPLACNVSAPILTTAAVTTANSTSAPIVTNPTTQGGYIALGVIIALLVCAIIAFIIYKLVKKKCLGGAKFDDFGIESPRASELPIGQDL